MCGCHCNTEVWGKRSATSNQNGLFGLRLVLNTILLAWQEFPIALHPALTTAHESLGVSIYALFLAYTCAYIHTEQTRRRNTETINTLTLNMVTMTETNVYNICKSKGHRLAMRVWL